MENKTIKKNANNIMWVEYWIQNAHSLFKDYTLCAERYDDYRWLCEIKLPLINKSVKSISKKEINAMLNASKKAAKLINEYMKEHQELKITNKFKGKRWEITSDVTGKFISIDMSSKWRREKAKQMEKMSRDSLKVIKKTIEKLAKINGTSKDLFIQVLDKSFFSEDKSIQGILDEVHDKFENNYSICDMTICYDKDKNSIIAFGYGFPNSERGMN